MPSKKINFNANTKFRVIREELLVPNLVVVDGQAGCGKTLVSAIVGSLERVELMNYAFELEWICRMHFYSDVSENCATTMSKLICDKQLYSNMMGRDLNFRFSDLSSVFRAARPWKYVKRLFQEGDMVIPNRIKAENPILNLTTHNLMPVGKAVFKAFGDKLSFIEVVRHPLFMVAQQTLNMKNLINNPRDISILLGHGENALPYFGLGAFENFLELPAIDQAIHSIYYQTKLSSEMRAKNKALIKDRVVTIPFENFVRNPEPYLKKIEKVMGTVRTNKTLKVMRRERVPRTNVVDGIPLAIYKRCGWEPPRKGFTEKQEYQKRREFVLEQGASPKCIKMLDDLSREYERQNNVF
jgi:hypothetical protein